MTKLRQALSTAATGLLWAANAAFAVSGTPPAEPGYPLYAELRLDQGPDWVGGSRPPDAWGLFRRTLADRATGHELTFGPKITFTKDSAAYLYFRNGRDGVTAPGFKLRSYGDELDRAGLAQIWRIADRGQFRIGYEFGREPTEDNGYVGRGHRMNLSSRIPLHWGVHARLEADYSRSAYHQDQGTLGFASSRQEYTAGLVGVFGTRFRGSLLFRYADEDFENSVPSYRRTAWGLNLRYTY